MFLPRVHAQWIKLHSNIVGYVFTLCACTMGKVIGRVVIIVVIIVPVQLSIHIAMLLFQTVHQIIRAIATNINFAATSTMSCNLVHDNTHLFCVT